MPFLEEKGYDVREARTARGAERVWALGPNIYVTRVTGHMEDTHADLFEVYGADRIALAKGPLLVFHDWVEMTGYESRCRTRLTEWSLARLDRFGAVHLAVRSKIVRMGIQVANIPLRGLIRPYPARQPLELALREAFREETARNNR